MGSVTDKWGEEYSFIEDNAEVGFIDYEDDKTVCSYNPIEEGPIIISVPFSFVQGKPRSIFKGERAADFVTIKNTLDDAIELWGIRIYASNPEESFTLSLMEPPSSKDDPKSSLFVEYTSLEDRVLQPGDTLTVWLSCKPKDIGLHTSIVHFDVDNERIERVVFLLAEDKISHSLASKKPYSRNTRKKQFEVDEFVMGPRPARAGNRDKRRYTRNKLPEYKIPKEIRELVLSKQIPAAIDNGLTRENYASFFKALLIMEEIQLEEDMRAHNMERVTMKKRGSQFLTLVVPGLAEKRPSLVWGDFVFAKLSSECDNESSPYQGYIHRVEADAIYLKFDGEFHFSHRDENLYDVQFTYNRVNMRKQYQAIDAAGGLDMELLFPSESSNMRQIETDPLVPISCVLNEEQMCAIEMILGCKGGAPYAIHGPPGTGKTMTIVEAILQLYKTQNDARILVCAPSNSAADHILEKLLNVDAFQLQENTIFRLNAISRPYEDMKSDYMRFCFFEECIFKCPPLYALLCYRIVISTYMSSALLNAEGVKRGQFTHIFMDEAGQASEPETMIPISNLCSKETVVVLAGDPLQLGPVIYSKDAEAYGLATSYLERLFECDFYRSGDENYVTKLVRNYRSHQEILHLPSTLFYNGELIACKDDTSSLICPATILPNNEFPLLFIGIQGCDEREGNNPSWFNRFEASKVIEIIKKLTRCTSLTEEDIGVITPYRQQVLKLKKALDDMEMPDIKVGSVEQFQGQEKQVIIVSTVRSTIKHNEFDRVHYLGFLSNPRRFNVAVTRAISLLIIIGNPHIISKDHYWNKLLWRCVDNNSYQGCPPPEREELVDDELKQEDCFNNEYGDSASSNVAEWFEGRENALPKLSTGENDWYEGWQTDGKAVPEESEWHEDWQTDILSGSQQTDLNPITDESEWSDGWKS